MRGACFPATRCDGRPCTARLQCSTQDGAHRTLPLPLPLMSGSASEAARPLEAHAKAGRRLKRQASGIDLKRNLR